MRPGRNEATPHFRRVSRREPVNTGARTHSKARDEQIDGIIQTISTGLEEEFCRAIECVYEIGARQAGNSTGVSLAPDFVSALDGAAKFLFKPGWGIKPGRDHG